MHCRAAGSCLVDEADRRGVLQSPQAVNPGWAESGAHLHWLAYDWPGAALVPQLPPSPSAAQQPSICVSSTQGVVVRAGLLRRSNCLFAGTNNKLYCM
jgi:hypothetical protein